MTEVIDLAAMFGLASHAMTLCGVAAILAAFLPQAGPRSSRWWKQTRRVLDALAANWKNARNR